MDGYDIAGAAVSVRDFLDSLTNWYVRRSRARFWAGEPAGFDTLYTVLTTLTRLVAPLLPMVAEEVYRGLTGERSVHLTDWPDPDELPADDALVTAMDAVREVASTALGVRRAVGVRVRMPLARLTVAVDAPERLAPFADLLRGEVNVKEVVLTDAATAGPDVRRVLRINPRQAGPRLGKDVQAVIQAARTGDWSLGPDGVVRAAGIALREGEYDVETTVSGDTAGAATAALPGGGFVVLDTAVTPQLAAEGLARDVIRAVAQARRDLGLAVWDRIRLGVDGDDAALRAVGAHRELIAQETLADEVFLGGLPSERTVDVEVGDGLAVRLMVERVP
jgi:isoleucyl-tRNA synthetase